jgi:hypothetical protein
LSQEEPAGSRRICSIVGGCCSLVMSFFLFTGGTVSR